MAITLSYAKNQYFTEAGEITCKMYGIEGLVIRHFEVLCGTERLTSIYRNANKLPEVEMIFDSIRNRYHAAKVSNGVGNVLIDLTKVGAIQGVSVGDREVLGELMELCIAMVGSSDMLGKNNNYGFNCRSVGDYESSFLE